MPAGVLETQEEVDQYLDRLVEALSGGDMSGPLKRWSQDAQGLLGQYMAQGRSPDGTPYKPLKNPRPEGHNQQSGPLIDFGDMLLSLVGEGSGSIFELTERSVTTGTEHQKNGVNVAAVHQYGTRDGRIPARPFVGWNDELMALAVQRVTEGLAELLSGL
jgi:hypothetical protein